MTGNPSLHFDESIRLDVAHLTGDVSATIDELANEAMESLRDVSEQSGQGR